jgi:hypothetical protein
MCRRKSQLLFVGLSQMILLSLLSACGGYIDTTQPPQSAIEHLVISQSLNTDDIRQVKLADYLMLPLSDADIANNITQRWCIALTYIYKNDSGEWQDGEISWVLAEKGKSWENDELMTENIKSFRFNENALTGTCDWVR